MVVPSLLVVVLGLLVVALFHLVEGLALQVGDLSLQVVVVLSPLGEGPLAEVGLLDPLGHAFHLSFLDLSAPFLGVVDLVLAGPLVLFPSLVHPFLSFLFHEDQTVVHQVHQTLGSVLLGTLL